MVSIIIPVYMAEKTLKKCVMSCINQTYVNIEILLIDDGSPDSCPVLCDYFASMDARIRSLHKSNGGVSSARNYGIDNADGEFLVFVDSDDWIDKDMIEKLVVAQKTGNYDFVLCNHLIHSKGAVRPGKIHIPDFKDIEDFYAYILQYQKEHCLRSPCGRLYRSSIVKAHSIKFNTKLTLGEDTLFNYHYSSFISTIYCLNDYCGYNVRIVKSDEKNKRYYKSADFLFKSRLIMFQGFSDIYRNNSLYDKYERLIADKFISTLSIVENIAVTSGLSRTEIIKQNRRMKNRSEINTAVFYGLSIRDKITLICYRKNYFYLMYYIYKIMDFMKRNYK